MYRHSEITIKRSTFLTQENSSLFDNSVLLCFSVLLSSNMALNSSNLQNQNYVLQTRSESRIFKLFVACVILIFSFSFFLDWNMTEKDRRLRAKLNLFYARYPISSRGSDPFDPLVTERRLSSHYPYNPLDSKGNPTPIEKNIWQMWRAGPEHPEFPYRDLHEKYINLNPEFKYNFDTNDNIVMRITEEFKDTVPEIAETLELLPSLILKSDFSRYVLLYLYGGSYSDLDVNIEVPISEWFDTNRGVGFVCGTELDYNAEQWWAVPRRQQIETWFFKSKARHPILRKLISTIVKNTFEATEKGMEANYGDKHGEERCTSFDIMDWTGPGVFTDIIYAYMNSIKNPTIIDTEFSKWNFGDTLYGPAYPDGVGISWKTTTGMSWPMLIGDVVLYPQHTLKEFPQNDGRDFYVCHYYSGSWKPS